MKKHDIFAPRPGTAIAYRRTEGKSKTLPGVIFLGGFMSDMQGSKAAYLEAQCAKRNQGYLRFDYQGHGLSSGTHEGATIGSRLADVLEVFDELTDGPQIVVGSSMGGWIMLLLALRRSTRLAGLVGIAPAPDFTEDVWKHEFSEEQRRHITLKGRLYLPHEDAEPSLLTLNLFEEAKNHLLLDRKHALPCPVRLLHGKKDTTVPWKKSEKIREQFASPDLKIHWVEDGDHRLSRPEDLKLLDDTIVELSLLYQGDIVTDA